MRENKDWFDKALVFQDEQNYSQAIVAIEKFISLNPGNKNGKLLKAVINGELSNYDLVLKLLNKIKPTKKDGVRYAKNYYRELGDTYKGIGRFEEAIKCYEKIIEIVPNETTGYIFKGCCLASFGKYELAKIEHLKATKLKGDPEEAYYNLALISRAEMHFEDAKKYCELSLKLDPNDKSVIHCYEDILAAIKMLNNN